MSILAEVFADLFKMFVADARMTAAILALVGAVAAVIHYHVMAAEGAGAVLLKIAFAATSRFTGGPAHAAIVGSALAATAGTSLGISPG